MQKSKKLQNKWPLLAFIFISGALLSGFSAKASEVADIPQIGPHHRLFIYEKNENPQNILVVYAKMDSQCRIQKLDGGTLFDFYWLMDRHNYKPTHALIKSGIRKRLTVTASTSDSFEILLSDLKEAQTDLSEARLNVQAKKNADGSCGDLKAYMTLDRANPKERIQVQSIYAEAAKTWNPLSRKLISSTIKGLLLKSGQIISRTYASR